MWLYCNTTRGACNGLSGFPAGLFGTGGIGYGGGRKEAESMSTVTQPGSPHGPKGPNGPEDPFRYGWRYVKTTGPDGAEEVKQIPLTLEDLYHPQEEDFIVQGECHIRNCFYLAAVLQTHLGDRALVTCDLRMAWDTPLVRPTGPDVTVIFGAARGNRGTFDCTAEGRRPTVVFEVVSPNTRAADLGPKVRDHYLARVPWYVIVDNRNLEDEGPPDLRVLGYRWTENGYSSVPLAENDRLWVEPLGVYVSVRGDHVVCNDAAGAELLDYSAEHQARLLADQQRQAERQQREAAEQQRDAERQQREAAEQQRDAERQQREAAEQARRLAEQQSEVERQQREVAEQAKLALEERLRQLEEQLRRPGGEP
jgi:hypothetical protein